MTWTLRSILLAAASLSAAAVAPTSAQVRQGVEPLLAASSTQIPVTITPAVLSTEITASATPELPEPGQVTLPTPDTDDGDDSVTASGDLNDMVAQLRSTEAGSRELECLAGAIYFESKSEPLKGQLAVGHVIANRAKSGKYPSSYCGVVYQRGQFSFVRGHSMPSIARSGQQWKNAVAIAKIVDAKLQPSPVGKALAFHARRVSPGWRMTRVATVGNHIFYR